MNSLAIIILLLPIGWPLQTDPSTAGHPKGPSVHVKIGSVASCQGLSKIRSIPFKKGETVDDPAYNRIMGQGKAVIPCLIDHLTDTTKMKDPRSAPAITDFRVGDLAFFLLTDITETEFEQWLPDSVNSKLKDRGVYAFIEYVGQPRNRRTLQEKWRAWLAQQNK